MTAITLPPLPEPEEYLFQHDETGQTMFVDRQQVEWCFEANNPRLHKIDGVYTASQVEQIRRDAVRAALGAAAKACESEASVPIGAVANRADLIYNTVIDDAADAIRALMPKEEP